MNGNSVLIKGPPETFQPSLSREDKEISSLQPTREPHQNLTILHPDLSPPASRTV